MAYDWGVDVNLSALLAARADDCQPVRVGLVGAGRFATMFLAQARHIPGLHLAALADPAPERGPTALALAQWPPAKAVARSLGDALETGGTWVTTDPHALVATPGLDVVIEATADALAGIELAQAALAAGIHVIMANVEADCLAGAILAQEARDKGLVYSLAYGDQAALICELVDWARASGLEIASAGKGTKYLPGYHSITPETVWRHFGITPEQARAKDLPPETFTAAMDGTRAALELASASNATGLVPPSGGLTFPPCGAHDLAHILRPTWDGGRLEGMGQIEAVSSEERDGRHVQGDLRWGVFITYRTPAEFTSTCFADYGIPTDSSGQYAARFRPNRMAGMELGVSVASVVLRGEPTGSPQAFIADVVAVAKRDLSAGEALDGIGGTTVWGRLLPAATAIGQNALPIPLARGAVLKRDVAHGATLTWDDVELDLDHSAIALRRRMEAPYKAS